VLDIGNVQVNGTITGLDDDGIHVAAYFGDTSGSGDYTTLDVQRIQRVIARYDSGFAAYPNVDPVLLGDISGNGSFSALDATRMLQEVNFLMGVALTDRPEVPALPVGITPVQLAGPDPVVGIPDTLKARAGETVSVPVNLDTAEGLESVQLTVRFDAAKLELVDVRRGTVTSDFSWYVERRDAGEVRVDMSRLTRLASGQGSLLVLDLKVKDTATGTVAIDLARAVLNDGRLTLNVLPVVGVDSTDGLISVAAAEQPVAQSKFSKLLTRLKETLRTTLLARMQEVPLELTQAPYLPLLVNTQEAVRSIQPVSIDLTSKESTVASGRLGVTSAVTAPQWQQSFVGSLGGTISINPNAALKVTVAPSPSTHTTVV